MGEAVRDGRWRGGGGVAGKQCRAARGGQGGQCGAGREGNAERAALQKPGRRRCPPGSPIIRQIRQACAEPFEAFEECLRQNEASAGNCAEQVRRFLQCAERVPPPRRPAAVQVETSVTPALPSPQGLAHSPCFIPADLLKSPIPAWAWWPERT